MYITQYIKRLGSGAYMDYNEYKIMLAKRDNIQFIDNLTKQNYTSIMSRV